MISKNPLKDDRTFLSLLIAIFVLLPVLYLCYLRLLSGIAHVKISEMLFNDANLCLNLVTYFSCIYSGFAIYQMRGDLQCRENMIGFYCVLVAQILSQMPITLMLMFIYVFHFIGFRKIFSEYQKTVWKKSYKALFPAIGVFIVSLIVLFVRIKMFL